MANEKDTKQEIQSVEAGLYTWEGVLVARIKEIDLTHTGKNTIAPVLGQVVFSEVLGEPSLVDTFRLKANKEEWRFQFVGEKPPPTFDINKGQGYEDYPQQYNYPIEIDRVYQFFARTTIPRGYVPKHKFWPEGRPRLH
jgi:hypothetical protein